VPKKLVIIIPAYNEEKTISDLIEKIPKLQNFIQEIIVIDDGSTDHTLYEAKKKKVRVISNERNLGLGRTFKKGLEEALKVGADYIINLDADAQYNPNYISILLKKLIDEEVDLVIGNRFLDDIELGKNFIQRLGNKILSILLSKILLKQKEIYDTQSGFRAINKKLAKFLIDHLSGRYTYTQDMMILSLLYNFKVKQISIRFYKRETGKSRLIKNPFIYLFKTMLISLRTYLKTKIKRYKS